MKSIGIITYHKHYNYGTMLQAFALQEAINKMGCSAEIIDFFQPNILSNKERAMYYLKKGFSCITNPRKAILVMKKKKSISEHSLDIKKREAAFDAFYDENIILSKTKYVSDYDIKLNPPDYDVYIVGSDQTWNPNVGGNPDAFYLSFVEKSKRRVSYGPSISAESLTREQTKRMAELLENVDLLSCREEQGAELIRNITGREVSVVLDPVFLLSQDDWNQKSINTQHPEKYILQYFLGDNVEHRRFVHHLSERTKLPVISLPQNAMDYSDTSVNKIWCGPGEFISLLRDATYVCTDSFHGTAFSLIFEKEVYSLLKHKEGNRKSENSRLENLYKTFGINDRIITDVNSFFDKEFSLIDYNNVRDELRKKRKASFDYLDDAIQLSN